MSAGVEQLSIRRGLQRTAVLAVLLGYGLLLLVTVQLFQQQRNQRRGIPDLIAIHDDTPAVRADHAEVLRLRTLDQHDQGSAS